MNVCPYWKKDTRKHKPTERVFKDSCFGCGNLRFIEMEGWECKVTFTEDIPFPDYEEINRRR